MNRDASSHLAHLSRGKKLCFWVILLTIPLAILEVGTRAYFAHELGSSLFFYGTRLNQEKGGDAHSGDMNLLDGYFKYHPHEKRFTRDKETGKLIRVTVNSRGFRGPEFNQHKDPHVVRVVTLGASSTFGFSDRDDETYPYYLEQFLNRDSGARKFEVINLGIPHLASDQIVALFEQEALPLDPDIVTFYEGINDSWKSTVLFKKESADPGVVRVTLRKSPFLHRGFRWLRDHFLTVCLADGFLKREPEVTFARADIDKHMRGKSENFVGNLSTIREQCRQRGIIFIVATQQSKSFLVDREHIRGVTYDEERTLVLRDLAANGHVTHLELDFLTHAAMMDALRQWARANQVPLVDVITAMDTRRDCLVSWVHLNAEGNRIVAHAFEDLVFELAPRTDVSAFAGHADSVPR
jgi:lysophospholipase L1-like esterase